MNAINRAIELCGGPAKLAVILGVTVQAVCFWRDAKRQFPAERCPEIEKATLGAVTCEELRPDVDWAYLRSTGPVKQQDDGVSS